MSLWNKIFGGPGRAERIDYYEEGLLLAQEGKFHEALTSLRLALKETPGDPIVLQQIAIAYTRIGMEEEAVKTYRHVLHRNPEAPGAHYGLAFLLLRREDSSGAAGHLEAFLANAPTDSEAQDHVNHARQTLAELKGGVEEEPEPEEA
ncbi:MAG: tetratricopeptide repeat protein [Gemmatimonadota bacterium]|nr:tetratricopeptide repeat protein [Gemmatimonadota bacterium]MDE2983690.1 tetratricopeptide repeat protein [Gemmatimonadota bacterium]